MSQPQYPHQTIHVWGDRERQTDTDEQHFPPRSSPNQTSRRMSHSSDTSVPLFTLYLRIAQDHDGRRRKLLKGDTDQILVFCGLFSATVAALIVPSISELYSSNESIPTKTGGATTYDPRPSTSTVLANSYWLLSLLLGILCALVALSLPRWAQPHTGITSSRYSLLEQARLHTYFSDEIERVDFAFLVEALHCLVHFAFSLFLIGLFQYFIGINSTVFHIAEIWIVLFFFAYACLTVMPILRPGSPYSTPFSNIVAVAYAGFFRGTSRLLPLVTSLIRVSKATQRTDCHSKDRFRDCHLGLMMFAQEKAQELAPQIDGYVLRRTLDMLRSDDDLEEFFEAIPGFCVSHFVDDPRRSLALLGQQRLAEALVQFWNRTVSSNRVSESVKGRRLVVCIRAIEAADLPIAVPRILHLFSGDRKGVSRSAEIGHSLGILRNGNAASLARGIIASIISINEERDERWFTLAMEELGISEDIFRRYLAHGDSVLLANLIHITRHFFHDLLQRDSRLDLTWKSLNILPSVSKFDILNTLPELQHEFCALWNDIVQQARSGGVDNNPFIDILVEIRGLCVALHSTDAALTYFFASTAGHGHLLRQPASYPICMMPDHCIQEASGSTTGGASYSTITAPPLSLSVSPVGDVPDIQHVPTLDPSSHTTTTIVQGIADTSLTSSMAQPITRSPSSTGDVPRPDEGFTANSTVIDPAVIGSDHIRQGLGSPSSASINALSHANPQAATIAGPDIPRRTGTFSSATPRANAQDQDPTI